MLKYSFMSKYSNCTKDEIINLIANTNKPCKFTYGYTWKNPTTYKVPMTREDAIKKINSNGLIDVEVYDDYIHINEFSDNDMW